MLTIFADKISQRLTYVLSIIFDVRKIEYRIVNDKITYKEADYPKFAYTENSDFYKDAKIFPSTILFEEEILRHIIDDNKWEGIEVLSIDGVTDVLGSIFYVITMYDDHLNEEKDDHGRNIGTKSLLYQKNWLSKLMVERWSEHFIQFLETQNACELKKEKIPFQIIPTFDIDNAYAYRLKKGWRKYFSTARDVLTNDKLRLSERKKVLKGQQKDPYDTYHLIEEIANEGFDVKVFWLIGKYGPYDKNVNVENTNHQFLIKSVDEFADVGLHPSYKSNESKISLRDEKLQLEDVLGREVLHSRQHFLKLSLPDTLIQLENLGFTDDYSLGYADQIGFRAGIARPFPWFNLIENRVSNLTLHPISYMDGSLNEYMELNIEEAINVVKKLKNEVSKFGGDFVPLWHNETIGDYGKWEGWSEVLKESLRKP